ncbi:MAG: hypothetical protein HQL82_11465 [Magnetococcales bacterium]|nr:hypothetical protein [Magnetococcales bacterium]
MSVAVHDAPDRQRILVLGPVTGATETALLAALESAAPGAVEVSLFDAPVVPTRTVLALAALFDRNPAARLIVYQTTLAYYLNALGIPSRRHTWPPPSATPVPAVRALALGGSADSLDKFISIIERLPEAAVPVFLVQHVSENHPHLLDQLLRTRTPCRVEMPHHLTPVIPGTLYIAPPGHHMRVNSGLLYLTRDRKQDFARPSIGLLFESLAREYGDGLVAGLLCGLGQDGLAALPKIRAAGGLVLVERADECQATALVKQAAAAGEYDMLCSWRGIASLFAAAASPNALPDEVLIRTFLDGVHARYGYDYRQYAPGTLQRRTLRMMDTLGFPTFYAFQRALLAQPPLFERLFQELSIGVTNFFRHPRQLDWLRRELFPWLASFPLIRIWVAGCASGEDAYSLAILLDEAGLLHRSRIFATDINPVLLQQGSNGLYPATNLHAFRDHYRQSGGQGDHSRHLARQGSCLAMAPHLRERILFFSHSLANDGVFNEFQLILCRNVFIYFQRTLQEQVLALFARSLHQGGYLVLGARESLPPGTGQDLFGSVDQSLRVYRRR